MSSKPDLGARLNLDLFYEVVDCVNNSSEMLLARTDLSNIMLTCRALYNFTFPLFYRRIFLRTRKAAHRCFTTLTKNDIAASFVREIHILSKRVVEDEGEYDICPLLPLFAQTLLRTPNLQCLMFDGLVYCKYGPYNHQTLSEQLYEFQLQTLDMSLYMGGADWQHVIPFLARQSQLRRLHLDFPPPGRYTKRLDLPCLESVTFKSSISTEQDIAAFFTHLSHITDVTVYFADYSPISHLAFTATRVTRYASNLASLTIKLKTMEQFDMFPNETPCSKSFHYLTLLMENGDIRPCHILSGIESLPWRWVSDLKSVFIEYNIPFMIDPSELMQSVQWPEETRNINIYFGRGDQSVYLVGQDENGMEWKAERIEWKDVPRIHTQAVEQAQFDWERL